jgi:hypothetical protein
MIQDKMPSKKTKKQAQTTKVAVKEAPVDDAVFEENFLREPVKDDVKKNVQTTSLTDYDQEMISNYVNMCVENYVDIQFTKAEDRMIEYETKFMRGFIVGCLSSLIIMLIGIFMGNKYIKIEF